MVPPKLAKVPLKNMDCTIEQNKTDGAVSSKLLPRILPFAVYLAFLAMAEGILWLTQFIPSLAAWWVEANLWLYPVKTIAVIGCLAYFWPRYTELKGRAFGRKVDAVLSVAVGVLIYLAWVRMDWPWATMGNAAGYDPFRAGTVAGPILAGIRLLGAAIVVPVMEELFWRSFLIRYMISPKFESVPLGAFTTGSFLFTVVLFGSEHHLWLAGIVAGIAYNLLLYRTRRLWPCIFAHGITNLILGMHVIITGESHWW
jgi:uncharacterized protein